MKRFVAAGLVCVCALTVILYIIDVCINRNDANINPHSNLYFQNNMLIFGTTKGDICTKNITTGKVVTVAKEKTLISACQYILCRFNNYLQVINYQGDICYKYNLRNVLYGEVHNNILYYIQEDGYLKTINLDTGEKQKINTIKTSAFKIYNNVLYYEHEKNSICSYDLNTHKTKSIFFGRYCLYFFVADDYLFLSDYRKNNCIIVLDLDGNVIKETKIRTINFCVKDKKIYYIKPFNEDGPLSFEEYIDNLELIEETIILGRMGTHIFCQQ
ncbi:MAG: DUF5050 domain-containing protein [Clostridia bacterium]